MASAQRYFLYGALFFVAISGAVDLYLSRFFPYHLTIETVGRTHTLPMVSIVALLALSIILTFLHSVKFNLFSFLVFPGVIFFIYFISLLYSTKPLDWKLSFFLLLALSQFAIAIMTSSRELAITCFDKLSKYFIVIATVFFLFKFVVNGFNSQMARGGLNLYTVSTVLVVLLLRSIVLSDTNDTGKTRLGFFFLSLISANRLGTLIGFFGIITKVKKVYAFMFLMITGFIFYLTADSLVLEDSNIYLIQRIFQNTALEDISFELFINTFISSRGSIWLESINYAFNQPLLGYGLGSFSDISSTNLDSAHNFFLNNVVELGILFGAILNLTVILIFYPRSSESWFPYLGLMFMLLVSGGTLVQPVGILSVLILLLFALAIQIRLGVKEPRI